MTNKNGGAFKHKVVTCHVAGPLVALEVKLPPGLGDVLRRLLFLDLSDLLLGIFTQEIHSWGETGFSCQTNFKMHQQQFALVGA